MKANGIVVEIVYGNAEAVVAHALLERVTQHHAQTVKAAYPAVEVDKRFKIVLVSIGYRAPGLPVIALHYLRMAAVVTRKRPLAG